MGWSPLQNSNPVAPDREEWMKNNIDKSMGPVARTIQTESPPGVEGPMSGMAHEMSTPPPSGGNGNANIAAPAKAEPIGSQGGGAGTTPKAQMLSAPEDQQIEVAQQSVSAVSSQSGKTKEGGKDAMATKAKINKQLNGPKMYDQFKTEKMAELEKQHKVGQLNKRDYKKYKKRWQNIFNIVPKEDFGLFMMDFGMRMMASAGQGETIGTSMGTAGVGALGGVQERQRYDQQMALQGERMAGDEAWRKMQLQNRPPDTLSTLDGVLQYNPDSQSYDSFITNPDTGERVIEAGAYNRPYSRQVLQQQLEDSGVYSSEDIARIIAGDSSNEQLRLYGRQSWDANIAKDIFPGQMSRSTWRGLSDKERAKYRDKYIMEWVKSVQSSTNQAAAGGALPSNAGSAPTASPSARPDGMDDYL